MTRLVVHRIRTPDGTLLSTSEREYEALVLATAGLTVEQISEIMGIKRATLASYLYRWTQRIDVHGRPMLAAWAIATGVVPIERIWELWAVYAPNVAEWQRKE